MQNAWDQFCQTVRQRGDAAAILRGEATISFARWHEMACACGERLRRAGFAKQGRVVLWIDGTPELAAILTGVWAAGGIPAILDASSPESHLQHVVRNVEPQFIVRPTRAELPTTELATPVLIAEELIAPPAKLEKEPTTTPEEPASIVFTSGSTGKPKGVAQSHGSLLRASRTVAGYLGLTAADRILCPVPWSFDYGYGQLLSTALHGVTQILPTAPNPFAVVEAIGRHRPTVLAGIPSWFTYLMRGPAPFRQADLSSFRLITNTGGTIAGPVLQEMFTLFSHCQIVLNYGLTETYRTSFLDPALVREHPTSIGRPIPGVDVAVVRPDGTIAEPGEIGELVHRGDYLFMGYWNNSEATAAALRRDPLAEANDPNPPKALFTGDLGSYDDEGLLYYHGRRDHQLKSMGVRVSPTEVERLLLDSGLVLEAAVYGVPHQLIGDEIWAYVVPVGEAENLEQRLRKYARETMSVYMAPQRYVIAEAIPKTSTGKNDYTTLKTQSASRAEGEMWR